RLTESVSFSPAAPCARGRIGLVPMLLDCHAMQASIEQLGAHVGKRIVFVYDRHLLPEADDYVAQLAAYGIVVTDTDPERLHYLSSAERVCQRVRERPDTVGVLACMTGIG